MNKYRIDVHMKAVQGVILLYLYIQLVQRCTACAAIYCRESYTRLIQLTIQRISHTAVHTLIKVCAAYTSRFTVVQEG